MRRILLLLIVCLFAGIAFGQIVEKGRDEKNVNKVMVKELDELKSHELHLHGTSSENKKMKYLYPFLVAGVWLFAGFMVSGKLKEV